MNTKIEILVIGEEASCLQTAERLLNSEESWVGTVVSSDEEAIEKFHQRQFDLVLLTHGISDEADKKLRKIFTHQNPDIIILYFDPEIDVMQTKIREALDIQQAARKPTVSFMDDALKNAGLQINIQ